MVRAENENSISECHFVIKIQCINTTVEPAMKIANHRSCDEPNKKFSQEAFNCLSSIDGNIVFNMTNDSM